MQQHHTETSCHGLTDKGCNIRTLEVTSKHQPRLNKKAIFSADMLSSGNPAK